MHLSILRGENIYKHSHAQRALFNLATMDSNTEAVDMRLWEEAKTSAIDPEQISWFFDEATFNITAVDWKRAGACYVSPRAFAELAIFDTMATFWESLPLMQKNREIVALAVYHKWLRQAATDELLSQPQGVTYPCKSPSVLHPWLKRTLCLLGHDDRARRLFKDFNYPPHLLDDGAF